MICVSLGVTSPTWNKAKIDEAANATKTACQTLQNSAL